MASQEKKIIIFESQRGFKGVQELKAIMCKQRHAGEKMRSALQVINDSMPVVSQIVQPTHLDFTERVQTLARAVCGKNKGHVGYLQQVYGELLAGSTEKPRNRRAGDLYRTAC